MATVTYLGESIDCATALKGDDYIHLLDENGCMIAAFDGVSDFGGFTITNGAWVSPVSHDECYLAVIREDGTLAKGGHKCSDISAGPAVATDLPASGTALAADTIYNVAATVETYTFIAPESGWAHGTFTTGTSVSITVSGKYVGGSPVFVASTTYEFDVLDGVWAFAEVL